MVKSDTETDLMEMEGVVKEVRWCGVKDREGERQRISLM